MRKAHLDPPDLTGPVLGLLDDYPSPSSASLRELVAARGQALLGLSTLSSEAQRRIDGAVAAQGERWKSGLLDEPAEALDAALGRLAAFGAEPCMAAGLTEPEDAATIEATLRAALSARDSIELRAVGLRAIVPGAALPQAAVHDARLRWVIDNLLPYAAFRRDETERPAAMWWWTYRLVCDRRALARVAASGAEPDDDAHEATCEACARELLELHALLSGWALVPSDVADEPVDDEEGTEHPSEQVLVDATLAALRPDALGRVLDHVETCRACEARVAAIEARLDVTCQAFEDAEGALAEVMPRPASPPARAHDHPRPWSARLVRRRRRLSRSLDGDVHVIRPSARASVPLADLAGELRAGSAAPLDATLDEDLLPAVDSAIEVRVMEAEGSSLQDAGRDESLLVLSISAREGLALDAPVRVRRPGGAALPHIELRRSEATLVIAIEGEGAIELLVSTRASQHVVKLRFERDDLNRG